MDVQDSIIKKYFFMGLSNAEINACLQLHDGITLSERTVKRRLSDLKLFRRKCYSDDVVTASFIENQLGGAGRMHGYKWMHLKCLQNGLTVTQESVRLMLSVLDAEGVEMRKRNKLRRRTYYTEGPNMIWHMDGYDKLKPYGIAIHGCIDGFSRHIIWLHAYTTNNDPRVIGGYYIDSVSKCGGYPRKIRADMGTENVIVEQMHIFLREQQSSFVYGKSVHNQRIEAWWGILRRQNIQFWINLLEGLKEESFNGSFLDKALVQFCFLHLIQSDLDKVRNTWDYHRIRYQKNQRCHNGKPYLMYSSPELYNTIDFLCPPDDLKVDICEQECLKKSGVPCDEDVFDICMAHMLDNDWDFLRNASDAVTLYLLLRGKIHEELGIV